MRMSFRLTPMAHTKNKLVTNTSGTTYRRSVMGVDTLIRRSSCQRAIEVNVATVDEHMLASGVAGLGRDQEYDHRSDFLRRSHPLFERNLGKNGLEFFPRIRKRVEPAAVERGHDLGRNDGIDANAIG